MTSTPPPATDRRTVTFDDGTSTVLTLVRAADPAAEVVLCLPAMGVAASYYEVLGDVLAEAGLHAVLADLRGNGGSSVRASRRVSFGYADILERELPAITEAVCREFGTDRVVVLGHSLGGQLGLLFAATSRRVSRVVLVASGSAWYRVMPSRRSRFGRFCGIATVRAVTAVCGYLPAWLPFAGTEARRLVRDWGAEATTGRYRVSGSAVDYERALAESIVPTLCVTLPGDRYVPEPCSAHLVGRLTAAPVEHRVLTADRFRLPATHHFRWALRPGALADAVTAWLRPGPETDPTPTNPTNPTNSEAHDG